MAKRFKVNRQLDSLPKLEGGTPLSFYDPSNPDVNLFNLIDDEIIRISGSPMHYFKSYSNTEYDEVYLEAANKTVASEPIRVYGHYEPSVVQEVLSNFGIELTNDQMFVFNKSYIESSLDRTPQIGDHIKPEFQNQKYEITEVQEDSFEAYGVYHLMVHAKLLRDTQDIHNQSFFDRPDQVGGRY